MDEGSLRARGVMLSVVGGVSSALAMVMRGRDVASPLVRLWRLASLKSRVVGVVPVSTQFDGPVETAGRVKLDLGEHCRLGRRVFLETCEGGSIRIGSNVRVNAGTFIVSYAEVAIGRDSLIGEYVSIRDADHGLATDRPIRQQAHQSKPIRIGEGVWIGRGTVILKGVTIGFGAVVAANSVVTRDVRPMTIVAGAPARELRLREAEEATPQGTGGSVFTK